MRRVLLLALAAAVIGGPSGGSATAAARLKEPRMQGSRDDAAPSRLVLDGVPQVRYFKDGICPLALAVKSCTDFPGMNYSYNYVLATSGACFRMSWNYTRWDAGNMDTSHLGPEPMRQALRAVGLKHRFLVKKTWWADAVGDDIKRLPEGREAQAVLRRRIIASVRAGMPVLAFGVVGPPEVSIVTGYDHDGDVLIGWSCFQGEHPKDQLEPDGAFRQRGWLDETHGIVLVERAKEKPDPERVTREALEWAYRVCTHPKTKTHVFGQAAYKGWAEGMLKDIDFPDDDEKTLQSRRYTVWDGLIMLAERHQAAAFLEEAAIRHPEMEEHLHTAARLFRADGDCGGRITQALGGHGLPSERLADPCARRTALDFIFDARERNAEALKHLALALGRPPGGFAFDGKELEGLRPARRWMTLLGCLKGCMRYLGKDVDDAWLYGVTGAAFMLNIDRNVDVSGPTSGDHGQLFKMAPRLGISVSNAVRARTTDADFEDKQRAAAKLVREKIDAGLPCLGWDGAMEWFTVNGYSGDACLQWSHYFDGGHKKRPWAKLGRNITECFQIVSVEPADAPADDRATAREALAFALSQRPSGKPLDPRNARGLQGYDLWIRCLETGDWRKGHPPGVHHNAACWHECRCYAERFLRLAGERLGGDLKPLFEEAADHYRAVRKALCEMQTIFIYKYPLPPVDEAGVARAITLLRTARDEEAKGLAAIERIVRKLTNR